MDSARKILPLLLVLFVSLSLAAQTDTARLQGIVADTSQAAIAGASVTVANLGTGRTTTVQTDAAGNFTVAALPPGRYTININSGNFKPVKQEITLATAQVASMNFTLQPGAVAEMIEVTSDVPLVEAGTSNVSNVIVGKQITELPLNGRNFTQLATLQPGVTRGVVGGHVSGATGDAETFRYGNTGGAALSVNGLRAQANNFLLDGVDNNESLVNTIVFFPPAEAIQEFRVDTSVAPAEFGRAGGAVVNTTTKSGSNQLHGSAFWFLRNDDLDAREYFTPKDSKTPEFKRHQFGGTFGGPIIKNKLFFFADYQGLRQYLPLNLEHATVPTQKMRNGDFSELLPGTPITNPVTGTPFVGNVIPSSMIIKPAQNYLNAFPMPNCTVGVDPACGAITNNFAVIRKQIQEFNDFDVRIDYNIRPADSLFGRFSYGKDHSLTSTRLPPNLPAGWGSGDNINWPRSLVLGETHTFTPNFINEFRAGWVRVKYGYVPPFGNVPLSADLGIPNANTLPILGGGALIGGWNGQLEYTGDYGPYLVPQNSFQYSDTMSWIKGKHNIKFGANIVRRQVNLFRPKAGKGQFFMSGNGTNPVTITGYEVSDLLAGFMATYTEGPALGMAGTRNWETGYFIEDDFKVSRRLTLNLGLRYDLFTWPSEIHNWQANFDLATGKLLLAGQNGVSDNFIAADKNNFAPRIGFAYDLLGDHKTILRGGYGMFYFMERGGIDNQLAQNPPFSGTASYNYQDGYRITLAGMGPMNDNNPADATGALPPKTVLNIDPNNPKNIDVYALLPTNKTPMVQQWNVQLQRELSGNSMFSVAYVGTRSDNLMTYYNVNRQIFNQPSNTKKFPNLNNVNAEAAIGTSSYHGLQARYERRLNKGLQTSVSYTWSHTIDDSPDAYDNSSDRVDINYFNLERGNSSLDMRHLFVWETLYELPFGRGKSFGHDWPSLVDAVIGGWQMNWIVTAQSGMPFDTIMNGNPNTRPDLTGNPFTEQKIHNGTWFNTAAFTAPPTNASGVFVRPGNVRRNMMYGPGHAWGDFSIFKNFKTGERFNTQFRAQFYNITNTPQFAQPDGNLSGWNNNAGKITGTRPFTNRQMEFALRVSF